MSDWLNDTAEPDTGYLGLDDPAMPDSAPAPPTAADADDWLTGSAPAQEAAPSMDDSWLGGDLGSAGQPAASAPAVQTYVEQAPAPSMAPPAHHDGAPALMPTAVPMAASFEGDLQVTPPHLEHVQPSPRSLGGTRGELSNLVLDVEVQVEVALGNAALTVEEFLEMGRGSVVELDTPVDAPIELKVRGKLIARGQLVSINGAYGMRIVEMVEER